MPRGAISQELDTGRILRYSAATSTWYVIQGAVPGAGGAVGNGAPPPPASANELVADGTASALVADLRAYSLLEETRDLLKMIAYALGQLKDTSIDELADEASEF